MVNHTGLSLEPPDFPVVPKAGSAGNVETVTRQPSFAHSVVTVGTELCSPSLPPKGHSAKWITHSLPFRSHKPQRQLLSWPPFSQRRKPRLTRGCQSCKAKPSPEHTSARHPHLRLPSRNAAPALYNAVTSTVGLHGKWFSKVTLSYPPIFQARSRRLVLLSLTLGSATVRVRPGARSLSARPRQALCLLGPSVMAAGSGCDPCLLGPGVSHISWTQV